MSNRALSPLSAARRPAALRRPEPLSLYERQTCTVQEAAEQLSVCGRTISVWVKAGYLRASKIGRRVLIHTDSIRAALAGEPIGDE